MTVKARNPASFIPTRAPATKIKTAVRAVLKPDRSVRQNERLLLLTAASFALEMVSFRDDSGVTAGFSV
ncbi:MAG: hypothetical protein Q4F60_00135 [Candidatus Saccharibacteria bacterium]|nr:hypothetical protein [Candidatus Saccharibacteria bacterium]